MKREINIFLSALMYYSRIPVPKIRDFSEPLLAEAFRYLPLVGLIVAGLGGLLFCLSSKFLPLPVAVILTLAFIMLLTGAMHEDGLADTFDGFGGGTSQEAILRIMQDSHIGTYGVLSLIVLVSLKLAFLLEIPAKHIPLVLLAAHGLSRACVLFIVRFSSYARKGPSKAQHTRLGISCASMVIGTFIGISPLLFFPLRVVFVFIPLAVMVVLAYRKVLHHKIGGFTGDTLGALQQGVELLFYLSYVAVA